MERKKSFILYVDQWETIKLLNFEQRADLLEAIFCYQLGIEQNLTGEANIVFSMLKNQFIRDDNAWKEEKLKRSEAGKIGGLASASKRKQSLESSTTVNDNQANQADTVTVTVNVNDTVNVKPLVRDINLQQCTSISSISNYINKKKDFVDPIKAGMIMGNVREAFKQGDDIRDIQLMVESALQNVFEQRSSKQVAKKIEPEKKEEPKQIYRILDSSQEVEYSKDLTKLDKNWLTKLVKQEKSA